MATTEEIQDAAEAFGDRLLDDMNGALAELLQQAGTVQNYSPNLPDVSLPIISLDGGFSSSVINSSISSPQTQSYSSQQAPSAPALTDITAPGAASVPSFDDVAPTLSIPSAPASSLPAAPGSAPDVSAITIPDRPPLSLPDVPTFTPVSVPSAQSIDLPLFTASAPIDDLLEPSSSFAFVESEYSSALLDSIKSNLHGDLTSGGYGIETGDELALWERMKARDLGSANAAIEDVATQMAARGFVLPPGAMLAAQRSAEKAAMDAASQASREIALKRADLYLQSRQFAISKGADVEQILLNYAGARAERALNAARAQIEVGISLYNLRVEKFKAKLSSYESEAQVFESKIRAQLSILESNKLQLESARLGVDIQDSQVQLFRAQVEAATYAIGLYRTDMEAAKIRADIEQLKLAGFRATVDAYAAQVGARETEFRMYEAQIRGETAKVDAYRASAQAYASRVDGVRTKAQTDEIIARAQIAANESKLSKFAREIDLYRAHLERIRDSNRDVLASYGLTLEVDKVLDSKEQTRKQTITEIQRGNAQIFADAARLNIANAHAKLDAYVKGQSMSIEAVKTKVDALSQAVVAALGRLSAVTTQDS